MSKFSKLFIVLLLLSLGNVAVADGGISRGQVLQSVERIFKETLKDAVSGAIVGSKGGKEAAVAGAVVGAVSGGIGQSVVEALGLSLYALEEVCDAETIEGIQRLRHSLDANTTETELRATWAQINATLSEHEARLFDLENRVEKNAMSINEIKKEQLLLRKRFEDSLDQLDLEIARIKGKQSELEQDIHNEASERRSADESLQSQIDQNSMDISQIYSLIAPETRRTTAAKLASSGAIGLLNGDDLTDVIRTLQLSVAYDKFSERHVDPGVRYYLAVAYRRAGHTQRADEMLSEAVIAERFRAKPDWFYRLYHRFQGSDRLWVQSRRNDPRFGVRAPRALVIHNKPKKSNPTPVDN